MKTLEQTIGSATLCQFKGCNRPAEIEISGYALSKPGWWRMCNTHRRVFSAQRPLSPNADLSDSAAKLKSKRINEAAKHRTAKAQPSSAPRSASETCAMIIIKNQKPCGKPARWKLKHSRSKDRFCDFCAKRLSSYWGEVQKVKSPNESGEPRAPKS